MTEAIISCQQISKRYGKKAALDGFSAAIPAGSIAGILGPNGCGKSTLFRMLAGLVRPDAGTVRVLGGQPGWRLNRDIAYLPDRARWHPNHTARQAFEWGRTFLPGFDMERALQYADRMDIELDQRLAGMSRGQEARVLLVLCMAREVPLIILDEPFAGIDVISRESIISGMIGDWEERQATILISTHDIHEIEGLFDYTVMMNKGRAIWSGDTETLRAEFGSVHDVFRKLYAKGDAR